MGRPDPSSPGSQSLPMRLFYLEERKRKPPLAFPPPLLLLLLASRTLPKE